LSLSKTNEKNQIWEISAPFRGSPTSSHVSQNYETVESGMWWQTVAIHLFKNFKKDTENGRSFLIRQKVSKIYHACQIKINPKCHECPWTVTKEKIQKG